MKESTVMIKIINPLEKCSNTEMQVYVKIELDEQGALTITGVEGPRIFGRCTGHRDQIQNALLNNVKCFNDGFNQEKVERLIQIWNEWNLNHRRTYCEHQKELGWPEQCWKEVDVYQFVITREASEIFDAIKKINKIDKNHTYFQLTEKAHIIPLLRLIRESDKEELDESISEFYKKDIPFMKKSKLLYLREDDHPDGLCRKPCPVCGHIFGVEKKFAQVPQDVIDWLFSLPDTKTQPAWI